MELKIYVAVTGVSPVDFSCDDFVNIFGGVAVLRASLVSPLVDQNFTSISLWALNVLMPFFYKLSKAMTLRQAIQKL